MKGFSTNITNLSTTELSGSPDFLHKRERSRWLVALAIALFLGQFLPFLLHGQHGYIRIHDTLEGEWHWIHLLFKNQVVFDYSKDALIPEMMGGLPRKLLPTGWSIATLWVYIFGSYWGYFVNAFVIHAIGFGGMVVLLRQYIFPKNHHLGLTLAIALLFSWLPVFHSFGVSVMGQPLLIWAFLTIANHRQSWTPYLYLFLFPFYSSVVWVGPPVILVGVVIFGYFILYKKQKGLLQQGSLTLFGLAVLYFLVNYQLFELSFFDTDFISHRVEYTYYYNKALSVGHSLGQSALLFTIGHYHIGSMVSLPIFFIGLLLWAWNVTWSVPEKRWMAAIVCICLFYGFYTWLVYFFGTHFSLLESFKFERVRILLPVLWFLIFASWLKKLMEMGVAKFIILGILSCQMAIGMVANDEFQHNLRLHFQASDKPTYLEFYSPNLFQEIEDFLPYPKTDFAVVHLGMHPTVSQFNGFQTLDAHLPLYPLAYKQQFAKAQQAELHKNPVIAREFNDWGNRCYLYAAELGKEGHAFTVGKNDKRRSIQNWSVDFDPLKKMGGRFLFSALKIENAPEIGLTLRKVFEREDAWWRIYVYEF